MCIRDRCPVLHVIQETPDIRTFRMGRPEGFDFSAGQFIAVRVRAEGKEHVRCYSVSSAPANTVSVLRMVASCASVRDRCLSSLSGMLISSAMYPK